MSIFFQSFRSSSAGNCLALWTSTSSILIDCGVKTQCECRDLLGGHLRRAGGLDAVVVSHAHSDHVAYGSLRVLGKERIPIVAHADVVWQVRERHEPQAWHEAPVIRSFHAGPFTAGDFHLMPVEVPHAPGIRNFAFVITARDGRATRRIVVCTDLRDYTPVLPSVANADFIFVEANHDIELLRQDPNFSSRYHLANKKSAWLLHYAILRSRVPPKAVMLGHLSEERNRQALAVNEVVRLFERRGTRIPFHLDAAPARRPSSVIEIA